MNTDGNERPSPQSWYPESASGVPPAAEEPAGPPQAMPRPPGATQPPAAIPMQGPPMQGPPVPGPPMQPQFMPPLAQGQPIQGQPMQPPFMQSPGQVRVIRANRGKRSKPLIVAMAMLGVLPLLASIGSAGWYYTRPAGTFGPPLDACAMLTLEQAKSIAPSVKAPTEKEPVAPDGIEQSCYWSGPNDSSIEGQVYSLRVQVEMFGRSFTKGGDENAKADFADDQKAYKTAPLSGLGDEAFQILPDKYGHNGLAFRRGNLIVNIEITLALFSHSGGDPAAPESRQGVQAAMAAARLVLQNIDSGKIGKKN